MTVDRPRHLVLLLSRQLTDLVSEEVLADVALKGGKLLQIVLAHDQSLRIIQRVLRACLDSRKPSSRCRKPGASHAQNFVFNAIKDGHI